MPRLEKFSEKSFRALSSRNRTWEGVGSEEEEDALKWRGFWNKADFHLGAMEQLTKRKKEGEKDKQKSTKQINI